MTCCSNAYVARGATSDALLSEAQVSSFEVNNRASLVSRTVCVSSYAALFYIPESLLIARVALLPFALDSPRARRRPLDTCVAGGVSSRRT